MVGNTDYCAIKFLVPKIFDNLSKFKYFILSFFYYFAVFLKFSFVFSSPDFEFPSK